jgi:2-dehydro-3-deoxyphosphogluconate aldolase/(4S)-4-hydroxy-2-oxoglutarate aldolase
LRYSQQADDSSIKEIIQMDKESTFAQMEKHRVIPVIAIESPEDALQLADALVQGGLPVAEITFRTSVAAEVIQMLTRERPDMLIGAGTVLTIHDLEAAFDAGAAFGVAPGLNERIVRRAGELGMPFIPGVATPTEIEAAIELGCKVLKFFAAEAFGGLKTIRTLVSPYLHLGIRFVPTGGINAENLQDYLSTNCVLAVGGTWLATKEDIPKGAWDVITDRCRQAVDIRDRT